jgi:hypothetical protein
LTEIPTDEALDKGKPEDGLWGIGEEQFDGVRQSPETGGWGLFGDEKIGLI